MTLHRRENRVARLGRNAKEQAQMMIPGPVSYLLSLWVPLARSYRPEGLAPTLPENSQRPSDKRGSAHVWAPRRLVLSDALYAAHEPTGRQSGNFHIWWRSTTLTTSTSILAPVAEMVRGINTPHPLFEYNMPEGPFAMADCRECCLHSGETAAIMSACRGYIGTFALPRL